MKPDFVVKLEVWDPKSPKSSLNRVSTLRIGVPVEALRAMAENSMGQMYVTDHVLADVSGVECIMIEADRELGSPKDITGLKECKSVHGEPKFEGWLGAHAGSQWWDSRDAQHQHKRERYVRETMQTITWKGREEYDKIAAQLSAAFDAGAGRKP